MMQLVAESPPKADVEALLRSLSDPLWRLKNLYQIVTDDGRVMPFRPNDEQLDLYDGLWYWNIICKARQLGYTTFVALMALDQCLFNNGFTAVMIAHRMDDAEKIFRNKIKFAYDRLPVEIKARCKLNKETGTELVFSNGSSISVTTSARSGTIQFLHVSEFGKICAQSPDKAREIVTGSFEAVPKDGMVIIESTAEGKGGYYHDFVMEAYKRELQGVKPNRQQFRLHFAPWFTKADYSIDDDVLETDEQRKYFETLNTSLQIELSKGQRAWYVAKAEKLGDDMFREYPSTVEEAFKTSIKGLILQTQMSELRRKSRITSVPFQAGVPVNTFWDLGLNDVTAIWCHQQVGLQNRFIKCHSNSSQGLAYYVKWLQSLGWVFGTHYLPHDADQRMLGENPETKYQILTRLMPGQYFKVGPRIDEISTGVDLLRSAMSDVWIDEVECAEGIRALDSYRFEWDEKTATYRRKPLHDWASNYADAMRTYAQDYVNAAGDDEKPIKHRDTWRG